MGASNSKSYADNQMTNITNSLTSAMISTTQGCVNGQTASQNVKIDKIENVKGLTIDQQVNQLASVTCFQTADSNVDFSTSITAAVSATVKAAATAAQAIGSAKAESYVASKQTLINNITNSVDVKTIQNCINSLYSSQGITIGQIISSEGINISQAANQSSVVDCVQKQSLLMKNVTDLATTMAADLSATTKSGFDLGSILIILIIVGAVVLLIIFGGPSIIIGTVFKIIDAVVSGTVNSVKNVGAAVTKPGTGPSSAEKAATVPPAYVEMSQL